MTANDHLVALARQHDWKAWIYRKDGWWLTLRGPELSTGGWNGTVRRSFDEALADAKHILTNA